MALRAAERIRSPGGYEALLIGEADGLARLDGRISGFQASHADDGGDDEIDLRMRGDGDRARGPVEDFNPAHPGLP